MNTEITLPLKIYKYADWKESFVYQDSSGNPIDLTGFTATLTVRSTVESIDPAQIQISTSDYISITGTSGLVSINVPGAVTSNYAEIVEGDWDLFLYGPSNVPTIRLIGGKICVEESVTR